MLPITSYLSYALTVTLLARSLEQIENIETSMQVIRNYIQTQIPYFITPVTESRVLTQLITSNTYSGSALGTYKFYKLS